MTKICSRCKQEKPFDQFGPDKRSATGLRPECRQCRRNNLTEKEGFKKYRALHVTESRRWRRKSYRKHKKRILKDQLARQRLRMKIDPMFRVRRNLRNRVWYAIKGNVKSKRTLEMLGCSVTKLKAHLESNFQIGMTWENYGSRWHIDHIIPCALFDLSKPEDQNRCFHYSNLQPLWATDNIKKGGRLAPAALQMPEIGLN